MLETEAKVQRIVRRRQRASLRGKATRAYLREHPEMEKFFIATGALAAAVVSEGLPKPVTPASLIYELTDKLRRRERNAALREWRKEYPDRAEEIRRKVRDS